KTVERLQQERRAQPASPMGWGNTQVLDGTEPGPLAQALHGATVAFRRTQKPGGLPDKSRTMAYFRHQAPGAVPIAQAWKDDRIDLIVKRGKHDLGVPVEKRLVPRLPVVALRENRR